VQILSGLSFVMDLTESRSLDICSSPSHGTVLILIHPDEVLPGLGLVRIRPKAVPRASAALYLAVMSIS